MGEGSDDNLIKLITIKYRAAFNKSKRLMFVLNKQTNCSDFIFINWWSLLYNCIIQLRCHRYLNKLKKQPSNYIRVYLT